MTFVYADIEIWYVEVRKGKQAWKIWTINVYTIKVINFLIVLWMINKYDWKNFFDNMKYNSNTVKLDLANSSDFTVSAVYVEKQCSLHLYIYIVNFGRRNDNNLDNYRLNNEMYKQFWHFLELLINATVWLFW